MTRHPHDTRLSASLSRKPWASHFARLHPNAYLGLHAAVGLILSALCTWAFFAIADALFRRGRMVRIDHAIARWVELHHTETGERIIKSISLFGDQLLWAILAAVALWLVWRRAWPELTLLVVGAGGGAVLNALLKAAFHRSRPVFAADYAVDAASFPSGHAMGSVIGYGLLAYLVSRRVSDPRRHAWLVLGATILAVGLGLTRMYLDVHYLSDIVAGFAAGGVWLTVCITGFGFARERFDQ